MENITDRMRYVMESKGLNAKGFAELLGIQRSGLSHIYSGRNKPGLDLIQKILEVFPDVSASWLVTGKGDSFQANDPASDKRERVQTEINAIQRSKEITDVTNGREEVLVDKSNIGVTEKAPVTDVTSHRSPSMTNDLVHQLILLRSDGTFTLYRKDEVK